MRSTIMAAGAALALAGCVETGGGMEAGMAAPAGNEPEAAGRQSCVRDVRNAAGTADVVVESSSFSQAGTEVFLRVGGTGRWRCIAYRDGTTADIMSVTDEGAL